MTLWFTADLHFRHDKIRLWCKRPFATIEEHDEALVRAWNARVRPGDRVYVCGDFCWRGDPSNILERLNGELYFLEGNHDGKPTLRHSRWRWVRGIAYVKHEGQSIMLSHYPMLTWRKREHGSWHLHGHSHNNLSHRVPYAKQRMDVGVDTRDDFGPWSFEEIRDIMQRRQRPWWRKLWDFLRPSRQASANTGSCQTPTSPDGACVLVAAITPSR